MTDEKKKIFEIVEDIGDELHLFGNIHRRALVQNYVKANYLPLISIALAFFLRAI